MIKILPLLFALMLTVTAFADQQTAGALDTVVIADQQSETAHGLTGDNQTGTFQGRAWRDGGLIQYTLDTHNEKAVDLVVTYWGGDDGRVFDILADDHLVATEQLKNNKPDQFYDQHYSIPASVLAAAPNGKLTIKFVAKQWVAGGLFAVSLVKAQSPSSSSSATP